MNKVFVFQNNKTSPYYGELKSLYDTVRRHGPAQRVMVDRLTVGYLEKHSSDIIISNGLPYEWYLIANGLNICTITIDNLSTFQHKADIVIDHLAEGSNRYFTGKNYSILSNKEMAEDFVEIVNLIVKLDWDTSFFGFPVAFLSSRHLTESIMYRIDKFIRKERIRLIEYLCNCHDRCSVRVAEKHGFHFADIRITLERDIVKKEAVVLDKGITFGLAKKRHIPSLRRLSSNLYLDSRYYFDGHFAVERVNEYYMSWVERGVLGKFDNLSYCLFRKGVPIGFCTIRFVSSDTATIGLMGFDKRYRGTGLAAKLLSLVFTELIDKGISHITVVTQGRNYAAQRLYQRAGFTTRSTEIWYHKWI